jgi:hypothetical protein
MKVPLLLLVFRTPYISMVFSSLFRDLYHALLSPLPHFLSFQFLSARLRVVQIPPSVVRSEGCYRWVVHPHPLINS